MHDPYAPKTTVRDVRQIARCRRCKVTRSRVIVRTTRVTYIGRPIPRRHATSVDTFNGERPEATAGKCDCGHALWYQDVQGVTKPDHKCDARCIAATGHHCECSCGGLNHGAAYG